MSYSQRAKCYKQEEESDKLIIDAFLKEVEKEALYFAKEDQ
ncbi:hypothetical protein CLOHYLEM_07202 [[Clostridium] hylemonae DSM 15053]|uniref:Uncharacterized protein n=1 Tax=[Clostridium] hylemonae DSM 15053 TaxID=553973 RepID=C0C534_9FIRM|nr:hypothetical protein CLOHYLEM_07202 [[Clostridium] hylemonae DSM 15053]